VIERAAAKLAASGYEVKEVKGSFFIKNDKRDESFGPFSSVIAAEKVAGALSRRKPLP